MPKLVITINGTLKTDLIAGLEEVIARVKENHEAGRGTTMRNDYQFAILTDRVGQVIHPQPDDTVHLAVNNGYGEEYHILIDCYGQETVPIHIYDKPTATTAEIPTAWVDLTHMADHSKRWLNLSYMKQEDQSICADEPTETLALVVQERTTTDAPAAEPSDEARDGH